MLVKGGGGNMRPTDKLTNGQHSKNISKNICNSCGKKVTGFRNKISEKEYRISGFCQDCQDSFFGKD